MYFNRIEAKLTAKASMRRANPSPILVSLVYLLLTGVLTTVIPRLLGDPMSRMAEYLMMGYEPEEVFEYVVMGNLAGVALFGVVSLLLDLYSTLMGFGFTSYALRMARNEQSGIGNLFDGFQKPLRVLWAGILMGFFECLWGLLGMLPGAAVLVIGLALGEDAFGLVMAGYWLMLVGFLIASLVVGLRYRLTHYFILDDPDCTARQAIRRSKAAMRGWKMELFTLDLSLVGWVLLGAITCGILMVWVGPYMAAVQANFYDAVTGRGYDRPQSQPQPPIRYTYDPNADGDGPI